MDLATNALLFEIRESFSDELRIKHINHPHVAIREEIAYTIGVENIHLLRYDPYDSVRCIVVNRGGTELALSMIADPSYLVHRSLWYALSKTHWHLFYNSPQVGIQTAALLKCRDFDLIMSKFDHLEEIFWTRYSFPKRIKKHHAAKILISPTISDIVKAKCLPTKWLLDLEWHKLGADIRTIICSRVSKKYLPLFENDSHHLVKYTYVQRADLDQIGKFVFDSNPDVRALATKRLIRKTKIVNT